MQHEKKMLPVKTMGFPDLPCTDIQAWRAYPEERWVYNKAEVARLQGLSCGMMPMAPTEYPVVLKPVINLYGMGWQAFVLRDKNDFAKHWGHTGMWMPFVHGEHLSIDAVVQNGEIQWWTAFRGFPSSIFGVFSRWEWVHQPEVARTAVGIFERTVLRRFSKSFWGVVCFECIGNTVIEAHLRPGDVGLLYDSDLVAALNACQTVAWELGQGYTPRTNTCSLWPVWWPETVPWLLSLREVADIASSEVDCVAVVDTKQPGAVVGGFVRPTMFVSSEQDTRIRKKIVEAATLKLLKLH